MNIFWLVSVSIAMTGFKGFSSSPVDSITGGLRKDFKKFRLSGHLVIKFYKAKEKTL